MPKTRPQDNVEINASAPTEEEHPLTNLTHRSGMQSFFFPKNISYFNEYNVFETSKENIKEAAKSIRQNAQEYRLLQWRA